MNTAKLSGTVVSEPIYNHTASGNKYHRFFLSVERKSGTADILPIIVRESAINTELMHIGNRVYVSGNIRTKNTAKAGERHKLLVYIFVNNCVLAKDDNDVNEVSIKGTLMRKNEKRTTPFGKEVTDFIVSVKHSPHSAFNYIPCIVWGSQPLIESAALKDIFDLKGRFQSRDYTKVIDGETVTKTAYELSVFLVGADTDSRNFQ